MTFQGSLKELHLPDVIQLVSVSGKTGAFHLEKDAEEGVIYLAMGQIVHAEMGDLAGEEAVYVLATWDDGTFRFSPGENAEVRTINKNNTNLLMEAARRLDEWRVLSKRIPSLDVIPAFKAVEGKQGQINLNTQEWMILSKIDGKRTIRQLAGSVKLSSFEVAKMLYGLVAMDLVDLIPAGENGAESEPSGGAAGGEAPDPSVTRELKGLLDKLREVAREYIGEVGQQGINHAYNEAKRQLGEGKGTESIQEMCHELLRQSSVLQGPESQRLLAEKFREVLSAWNGDKG